MSKPQGSLGRENFNAGEVMTGGFLVLVALMTFYLAYPLSVTTDIGIGPGFVPDALGAVQLLFGLFLTVRGFMTEGAGPIRWQPRPLLVLVAIAFFGVTIERLGLAIALTGLVLIACLAYRETRWREAVALVVGSVVLSDLVFVRLLGLSMEMWPQLGWGN